MPDKAQPAFILGQEWIYYKIYCGPRTADSILADFIKPLTESLLEKKIIDKWFFIRYLDPDLHLRLRFHLTDVNTISTLIHDFEKLATKLLEQKLIWKLQTDTYLRELWRYGENSMTLAEDLFFIDSVMVMNLIEKSRNQNPDDRWKYALKCLDSLMKDFGLSLKDRYTLMSELSQDFIKLFNLDKEFTLQLDHKFRKERKYVNHYLNPKEPFAAEEPFLSELIDIRSEALKPIFESLITFEKNNLLLIKRTDLLKDVIHLVMNRLLPTKQRVFELVLYYFLSEYYHSAIAQEIYNN
jgi:lantibiotic biosynthesis protein